MFVKFEKINSFIHSFRIAITPMKLHGARQLGSTLVLLNNIDKYVKRVKSDLEKGPLERFQAKSSFDSSFLGSSMQK